MKKILRSKRNLGWLSVVALAATFLVAACGGGDGDAAPTERPTVAAQIATAEPEPTVTTARPPGDGEISVDAASATITVDGDSSDWDSITGVTVPIEQIRLDRLDPAQAADIDFDPVPGIDVTLRIATDAENIYVLVEVPDDYDFNPEDHNLSAALAVQFRIEEPAAINMGASEEDLDVSLGIVDIWHWELDCGPGELSGGTGVTGGDDAVCNFDDEFALNPEAREDDGGGNVPNDAAENSLVGVWGHTAQAEGNGAAGTWIFEMSRPLQTGDPQDAQFLSGDTTFMALAYFDADESATGWSDAGHLTSAYNGWIEVTLP